MDTTLDPKQTAPRHVLLARADEEVAHAYAEIKRADKELARADQRLSKLERGAVPGNRRLFDRPAVRGLTGLLLTACIGAAAIASQSSYGDAAKEIIGSWAPQRVVTSAPPPESPGLPAPLGPSVVQAIAANAAPPAETAPQDVAPPAAALSPELTQLLQSMARDLATLGQGIEQLKAGQEQMARDNATAVEQLKASQEQQKANQEQMARVIAKVSEQQNLRPKISAPPPRPTATPARMPAPKP
ncbi:MAG TPA: hypothetical protein VE267_17330 [Bradyrhizobium sp.]|nr:hypothetical protein [Bradyrhizobium sp.]